MPYSVIRPQWVKDGEDITFVNIANKRIVMQMNLVNIDTRY